MPYEPSSFLRSLPLFTEDEHQPFRKSARGAMRGAALLVHGFPGTPADMRPLAGSLAAAGWDVDAPLLPGFGPQIITLPNRRHAEWRDAIAERVRSLRTEHDTVIVVGHSLGASVSIVAAHREMADGYALLAPYWRFGGPAVHVSGRSSGSSSDGGVRSSARISPTSASGGACSASSPACR